MDHSDVANVFAANDLFFFPTHGENFGHVLYEALSAGCPLLISDQTFFRNVQKMGAGWDIKLENTDDFKQKLEEIVKMDEPAHRELRENARAWARLLSEGGKLVQENCNAFRQVLKRGGA